jgi:hypothetical protein
LESALAAPLHKQPEVAHRTVVLVQAVAPAPSTAKKSDTKDMMLAAQIVYLDLIRHMLSLQLVPR